MLRWSSYRCYMTDVGAVGVSDTVAIIVPGGFFCLRYCNLLMSPGMLLLRARLRSSMSVNWHKKTGQ